MNHVYEPISASPAEAPVVYSINQLASRPRRGIRSARLDEEAVVRGPVHTRRPAEKTANIVVARLVFGLGGTVFALAAFGVVALATLGPIAR